jgi:hypothetical protein
MTENKHPADFIHLVPNRRGIWVASTVGLQELGRCSSDLALCFPDLYDIGMSHLGTKILYSVVSQNPIFAWSGCSAPGSTWSGRAGSEAYPG